VAVEALDEVLEAGDVVDVAWVVGVAEVGTVLERTAGTTLPGPVAGSATERPLMAGNLPAFVASTGNGFGTLVPLTRWVSRTALTTRRETASKRGLQVVRVSSAVRVASRTATSDGATTNWLTTR
jgi:hypothetical protein